MSFRFLKNLFGTDAKTRTRTLATRLNVESLEARDVPAALNLTTVGSQGEINGAIFQQVNTSLPGTLQSFVRLDADGVEQGYNTDARPTQFDERPNRSVTRSLQLKNVPEVTIGSTTYREFVLDINQTNGTPRLSLDELRIFVHDTSATLDRYNTRTDRLNGQNAIYDMDAGAGNNWVVLNARHNRTGTSGDMRLYVPSSLFGTNPDRFVYLYSKFGQHNEANGGYEEWSVRNVPAPTLGSISGFVFFDEDNNEVLDEFEAMVDFVVYIDANNNETMDDGELSTATDINGFYSFTGLAAGVYNVRVDDPDGQPTVFGGELREITLGPGEEREDVTFRFISPE
jgi:hypothetical protein